MENKPAYEELEQRIKDLERGKSVEQGLLSPAEDQESMYRLILENISDTVIVTDDQGNMLYVCPSTTIIFGLSQDQVYNQHTIQRLMDGTVCDISALKNKHEIKGIERSITNSYGKTRCLLINAKSVSINGGTVLYVMHDITDHKQYENDLKKYKNIVSSTPDGIAFLDENYRYVIVNDAYQKFSGMDREQFIGMSISEYLGDEIFKQHIKPNFDKCLQGEIVNYQEWFEYPSLGKRFVDITYYPYREGEKQQILGVIANTRDLTERKRSEIEILKQKRLFETMFNTIPDGVVITNARREIQLANKGMFSTFGYTPDELFGKSTIMLYADQTHYRETGTILFNKNTKKPGDLYVTRYRHKNGREFSGETFGAKLFDENNQWIGNLGIMRDITEREQSQAQIQQAQKMESIGNLSGGIAHDFNNILFPIIGMSELLLEDLPPNSQQYENAQEILKAGRRGGDLVRQILAFSRQSEHKLIPIRVQKVLKEVMKLIRSTIPSYIEIIENIQSNCGLLMADPAQIHQIAMNIITNAFHAVESKGGKIYVQLKEVTLRADELKAGSIREGRYALFSVTDTGHGISSDLMPKIFEPYFTTKERGKGTGLGLALAYGIIKEHKGDIKVYSEIGKGTTFNVYLPLMEKHVDLAAEPSATEKLYTGSENILLVDDEKSIAKLEKQMLERLGYRVTARVNSLEALEAFKANPDEYDLILTDMTMPNMTGDQLARKLIAIRPDIPIVICTGFSERLNEGKADAIGVKGFLMKPIVKSEIARMVRKVLDEAKDPAQG